MGQQTWIQVIDWTWLGHLSITFPSQLVMLRIQFLCWNAQAWAYSCQPWCPGADVLLMVPGQHDAQPTQRGIHEWVAKHCQAPRVLRRLHRWLWRVRGVSGCPGEEQLRENVAWLSQAQETQTIEELLWNESSSFVWVSCWEVSEKERKGAAHHNLQADLGGCRRGSWKHKLDKKQSSGPR